MIYAVMSIAFCIGLIAGGFEGAVILAAVGGIGWLVGGYITK